MAQEVPWWEKDESGHIYQVDSFLANIGDLTARDKNYEPRETGLLWGAIIVLLMRLQGGRMDITIDLPQPDGSFARAFGLGLLVPLQPDALSFGDNLLKSVRYNLALEVFKRECEPPKEES